MPRVRVWSFVAVTLTAIAIAASPGSASAQDGSRRARRAPDRVRTERSAVVRRVAPREDEAPIPAAAPPGTAECDALTETGERIACRAGLVQEQLGETVDAVSAPDADLLTETQKKWMRDARDRAGRETDRTGANGFKRLARKTTPDCFRKEYDDPLGMDPDDDGNNDGVCDKGELCEEVNGDQIGNDDSKCTKFKERGGKPIWEVCVEVCDPAAIDADEDNYDDALREDVERTLQGSAVLLQDMNAGLRAREGMLAAPPAAALAGDDVCTGLLANTRQFPYVILQYAQASANALSLAHDACADASRQDWVGFNWSAACIPLAVDANLVRMVYDSFELQDDAVTGERVDATATCLRQLGVDVAANKSKADGLATRVEEARTEIEPRLAQLILLINTPPGKRPDFPGGVPRTR